MINRFKKYYNVDNADVTPPDPEEGICYQFTLEATLDTDITFSFIRCGGVGSSTVGITVPANSSTTICAKEVFPPAQPSNKWLIYLGFPCE